MLDPNTNKRMKIVMWSPTKKLKVIPIVRHFHDGSLDNVQFWSFNETIATVVIKFPTGTHRLVTARDLLKLGERDIHTLSRHQIVCKKKLMESGAKEFTSMIAMIIDKKMWLGAMGKSEEMLIEKD